MKISLKTYGSLDHPLRMHVMKPEIISWPGKITQKFHFLPYRKIIHYKFITFLTKQNLNQACLLFQVLSVLFTNISTFREQFINKYWNNELCAEGLHQCQLTEPRGSLQMSTAASNTFPVQCKKPDQYYSNYFCPMHPCHRDLIYVFGWTYLEFHQNNKYTIPVKQPDINTQQ